MFCFGNCCLLFLSLDSESFKLLKLIELVSWSVSLIDTFIELCFDMKYALTQHYHPQHTHNSEVCSTVADHWTRINQLGFGFGFRFEFLRLQFWSIYRQFSSKYFFTIHCRCPFTPSTSPTSPRRLSTEAWPKYLFDLLAVFMCHRKCGWFAFANASGIASCLRCL